MQRLGTILKHHTDPIHDLDRFSLTPAGYAALDKPAQSVRQVYDKSPGDGPATGQPKPEWVRGVCPECGGPVVSNCYYVGGRGYVIVSECWYSLADAPSCNYRKAL